jgi:hypothetical protein
MVRGQVRARKAAEADAPRPALLMENRRAAPLGEAVDVGRCAEEVVLPRVMAVGMPGLHSSHVAGLSAVCGSEISSPHQACGWLTADGLRTPHTTAVVDGHRPMPVDDPVFVAGGGIVTISPAGYRAYPPGPLQVGTGLVWRCSAATGAMRCADPEIVVARWNGVGAAPGVAAVVGTATDPSKERWWAYISLCPTVHPFEAPADALDGRIEVIVAATCTAWLATQYVIADEAAMAELVLSSVVGPVSYVARRRMAAAGLAVPATFYRLTPDHWRGSRAPWRHGPEVGAGQRAPEWAVGGARTLTAWTGVHVSVTVAATELAGASPVERVECDGWCGPFLRFGMAHFQPHGGGGPATVAGAGRALSQRAGRPVRLPNTDGASHTNGIVQLPSRAGTDVWSPHRTARWLALTWATAAPRAKMRAASDRDRRDPAVAYVSEADLWFSEAVEKGRAPGPDPARGASRQAPGGRAGRHTHARAVGGAAAADWEPPPLKVYEPDQAIVDYASAIIRLGPPAPAAFAEMRRRHREAMVRPRVPRVEPEFERLPTIFRRPGAPPRRVARTGRIPMASEHLVPTPPFSGAPRRLDGFHIAAVSDDGFPRVRSVRTHTGGGAAPYEGRPLVCGPERRGVLATAVELEPTAGEPWRRRSPASFFGVGTDFHTCGRGAEARGRAWAPLAVGPAEVARGDLAPLLRVCATVACDPLARNVGLWFDDLPEGRIWAETGAGERGFSGLCGAARADAETLFAVALTAHSVGGRLAAMMWRATTLTVLYGGGRSRKRQAGEAHLEMLRGGVWRGMSSAALAQYQRWLSRGGLMSSASQELRKERLRATPHPMYLDHEVPDEAGEWILAAGRDTRDNAIPFGACVECGDEIVIPDFQCSRMCDTCGAVTFRAYGRGGGTPALTRRSGGGHAAIAAAAHDLGLTLGRGDARQTSVALRSEILQRPREFPPYAVWTCVWPPGQVGARWQETPSVAVAAAAPVLRAALRSLTDHEFIVSGLDPKNAALALGPIARSVPLQAFDAKSATDGQRHELLRAFVGLSDPIWGIVSRPGRARHFSLEEEERVDLRGAALRAYLNYESVEVTPEVWAARASRTKQRALYRVPVAPPMVDEPRLPATLAWDGWSLPLGADIIAIDGPTGSGKTRAALALDAQAPTALVLPTRVAITAGADDAAKMTGRPTSVVFFRADRLDPGCAAAAERGDEWRETGAATTRGHGWAACERTAALAARRVMVTPYQLRARVDMGSHLVVIDEVHELTWERVLAVASAVMRGARLVLVSATPPLFLAEPLLAGRKIVRRTMQGPALSVRIVQSFEYSGVAEHGPGLRVFGSVVAARQAAQADQQVELHGLLTADETEAALRRAQAGETVCATVGVVRSAVTLGDVRWIRLDEKLKTTRRYQHGSGAEYQTPMTEGELVQLLGRCARLAPYGGVAEVPWMQLADSGVHASWPAALRASKVRTAAPTEATKTAEFLAQLAVLGPAGHDEEAVLACQMMGASAALVPYMRAAYEATTAWLGCDLARYPYTLAPDARADFEAGQDPGTSVPGNDGGSAGSVTRTAAVRYSHHRAHPEARAEEPTLEYAQGLLLRLGPGAHGAYGVAAGLSPATTDYAELLAPLRSVPDAPFGVPAVTSVGGVVQPTGTVPLVTGASASEMEIGALERLRAGRTPRMNDTGTAMGAAANGPVLNSMICAASRAADILSMICQLAHGTDPPEWAAPYAHVPPPTLPYVVLACSGPTAGDDGLVQGDDLRAVGGGLFRGAMGALTGQVKTSPTGYTGTTSVGIAGVADGTLVTAADGGREIVRAFGGKVATGVGGIAPFVERYFRARGPLVRMRPLETRYKSIVAALRGAPSSGYGWDLWPKKERGQPMGAVQRLVALDAQDAVRLASWVSADERRPLGGAVPPTSDAPTSLGVRFVASGATVFSTPSRAGRSAGRTHGMRVLAFCTARRIRAAERGALSEVPEGGDWPSEAEAWDGGGGGMAEVPATPPTCLQASSGCGDTAFDLPPEAARHFAALAPSGRLLVPASSERHMRMDLADVPPELVPDVLAIASDPERARDACVEAHLDWPEMLPDVDDAERRVVAWLTRDADADGVAPIPEDDDAIERVDDSVGTVCSSPGTLSAGSDEAAPPSWRARSGAPAAVSGPRAAQLPDTSARLHGAVDTIRDRAAQPRVGGTVDGSLARLMEEAVDEVIARGRRRNSRKGAGDGGGAGTSRGGDGGGGEGGGGDGGGGGRGGCGGTSGGGGGGGRRHETPRLGGASVSSSSSSSSGRSWEEDISVGFDDQARSERIRSPSPAGSSKGSVAGDAAASSGRVWPSLRMPASDGDRIPTTLSRGAPSSVFQRGGPQVGLDRPPPAAGASSGSVAHGARYGLTKDLPKPRLGSGPGLSTKCPPQGLKAAKEKKAGWFPWFR